MYFATATNLIINLAIIQPHTAPNNRNPIIKMVSVGPNSARLNQKGSIIAKSVINENTYDNFIIIEKCFGFFIIILLIVR